MNKNTVWAILLIGAILVGFSLYNSKAAKEQQRAQFVSDSIAREQALKAIQLPDAGVEPVKERPVERVSTTP
ncbi:MAG: membrane protein insertase YidC, partial [Bacteroidales bacterium]